MDLEALKRATHAQHESVEAAVPLMRPGLTREQYILTLLRLYEVVSAWEAWSSTHAPASLRSLLAGRKRGHLLQNDLAYFNETALRAEQPALTLPDDPASFLGAMYVMEGSTLGGQYIARHVERVLHLNNGKGSSYFRGYGERTAEMWREFRQVLAAVDESEADAVTSAARAMFATFSEWMMLLE